MNEFSRCEYEALTVLSTHSITYHILNIMKIDLFFFMICYEKYDMIQNNMKRILHFDWALINYMFIFTPVRALSFE